VRRLVIHERVHPLAARIGLERARVRRDVEHQRVVRRRRRARIAVVGEVLQHDGGSLGRRPLEGAALPCERVGERAPGVRREIPKRIEPDQPQVGRLEERHPEAVLLGRRACRCKPQQDACE